MNDLIEIRGPHHAFEMRGNTEISYADAEQRMRALGCPEAILTRMRARSLSPRKRSAVVARRTSRSLAEAQGTTDAVLQRASDEGRRSVARAAAKKISMQTNADLRARAARLGAVISSDAAKAAQEKRDSELRERMENAAGRVSSRSKTDDAMDDYEEDSSGAPEIYPYKELASAVSKQFPGHKMVGANSKTAYTKANGMKYSVPYSQNSDGSHTFQQPQLGGHPSWLQDEDVS